MPIKRFNVIYWALIFLTIGFIASPTIVSLYHILIIIPAILIIKQGQFNIKLPKSSLFLLALCFWGIISTFYNLDTIIKPRKSFDDLKFYLLGVVLIFPLRYFIQNATEKHIQKLFKILVFIISAAFIVGIIKAFFGFDLVKMQTGDFKPRSGGFTNYMRYGYSHAFLFILGIGMLVNYEKVKKYINLKVLIYTLALCFLAVFTSKTRGALLAILVGLPFMFLKYKPLIAKIVIAIGTLFLGIVIYFSVTNTKTSSRFLNINDGSNHKRMSQFYSAVKSIQEKPIFGLGSDQFSYNVPRLKEKYDIWAKNYQGHSHNIFLEHAANFGIVGLVLFLGFIICWFLELIKFRSDLSWVLASYLVAFVVSGQVENLFDNTNSHLLFFIYSLSYAIMGKKLEKQI